MGINGCGKSTLLRMLAARSSPRGGRSAVGRGVRVGFLPQQPVLPAGTVREAVGGGWQGRGRCWIGWAWPVSPMPAPTGCEAEVQAKRTALAQLLTGEHEVLILDEPTNHLDLDAIQFLEDWLAAYAAAGAGHPRPARAGPGDRRC
ncbi:MAG: ATP-binding cassette domain-containing protein [Ilumatobacteraceae bacterium]